MDFHLDQLTLIPDPYEAVAGSRPPPDLGSKVASRDTVRRRRRVLLVAVLAVDVAWTLRLGVGPRPELPAWFVIEAFGLPAAGAVLAWYAAMSLPGRLGLGLSRRRLVAAIAITVVGFGLSALLAPESARRAFTLRGSVGCLVSSLQLAALPFAAGLWAFRRTLTGCAWARMASFGIACGSLAGVLMRVHCPNEATAHVLLGHGAGIVLFGLLGAAVGRGTLRV